MDQPVYYTYYQSPVGLLRIAATTHVITEALFADAADFTQPGHQLTPLLSQATDQLIEYFNGRRRSFELPVYQQGTTFQNRVWGELLDIPFGKTISYLQLARLVGDDKATRAVASTNAKNNICIIVPCHRVVGSNGSLVGYRGGLKRKKWLLTHEHAIAHGIQTLF